MMNPITGDLAVLAEVCILHVQSPDHSYHSKKKAIGHFLNLCQHVKEFEQILLNPNLFIARRQCFNIHFSNINNAVEPLLYYKARNKTWIISPLPTVSSNLYLLPAWKDCSKWIGSESHELLAKCQSFYRYRQIIRSILSYIIWSAQLAGLTQRSI